MRPDEPAVRRFLAASMIVRLATLSAKGRPEITPLWFVSHGGRIYMATGASSLAVRNVAANAQIVLLFHGERSQRSGQVLRIQGRANFRKGIRHPAILRFAPKYYLSLGAIRDMLAHWRQVPLSRRYHRQTPEGGLIEVVPESAEFLPALPR